MTTLTTMRMGLQTESAGLLCSAIAMGVASPIQVAIHRVKDA